MIKVIVYYGIIYGVIWIIHSFLRHITDNRSTTNWVVNILEFSVHISIISRGILVFRSNNNGFLKIVQALKIGIGITVIGCIIQIFWDILLLKVIAPDTLHEIINQLDHPDKNKPLHKNRFLSRENDFLLSISLWFFFGYTIFGALISFICGVIMHKKQSLL